MPPLQGEPNCSAITSFHLNVAAGAAHQYDEDYGHSAPQEAYKMLDDEKARREARHMASLHLRSPDNRMHTELQVTQTCIHSFFPVYTPQHNVIVSGTLPAYRPRGQDVETRPAGYPYTISPYMDTAAPPQVA